MYASYDVNEEKIMIGIRYLRIFFYIENTAHTNTNERSIISSSLLFIWLEGNHMIQIFET